MMTSFSPKLTPRLAPRPTELGHVQAGRISCPERVEGEVR